MGTWDKNRRRAILDKVDTNPLEAEADHPELGNIHLLQKDFSSTGTGKADEGTRFHIIEPKTEISSMQTLLPLYLEHVAADAADLATHAAKHVAEVLDMWLAGRVANDCRPLGEAGGHDDILGTGDGRLVEENVVSDQMPFLRGELDVSVHGKLTLGT